MNKEEESIYLQNIEEYIFEENKIVTYQWLCKSLGLHVNICKQLLYTFATQESKKHELSITYLLAGVPKDGLGYHVTVVKNDDLTEAKKGFQSISSQHVYSVQKVNTLTDLNLLYTVNNTDDHMNKNFKGFSSIDFDSVERDSAIVAVLRAEALPVLPKQPIAKLNKIVQKSPKKPTSPKKQISPKKDENGKNTTVASMFANAANNKKQQTTSNTAISPKKPTSPKKQISPKKDVQVKENGKKPTVASMFASASNNKKQQTTSNTAIKTVKDSKLKSKGIGAFFSKAPVKHTEVENNVSEKKIDMKMEVDEDITIKENKNISSEKNKVLEDKPDNKSKEETTIKPKTKGKPLTKESKGKKRTKKSNDDKKVVKKRKRIVVMSDSESTSDEDESDHIMERDITPPPQPVEIQDESEDIIEDTPEPNTKKHKRRLVNRTYTDEEGYINTKKEYVVESCSDEEDSKENKEDKEEKTKNQDDSKSTSKTDLIPVSKKQPQKTKQTNLMSFFGGK